MTITTNVANCINDQVTAYRELAQKAWGGDPIGNRDSRVVAALKQFFYNLDFLLKYGHFPSVEDTAQNALPEELRGLREFLETSQCAGTSYILQKDINTRYRFTWSDTDKITVTEERRYSSPAGARTGYACKDIWRKYDSQDCTPEVLRAGGDTYTVSTKVCQQIRTNQDFIVSMKLAEDLFVLDELILKSSLLNKYNPAMGHKFTVGDVSGSPVAILLAGFASGTLKLKQNCSFSEFSDYVSKYNELVLQFSDRYTDSECVSQISELASGLMNILSPVSSGLCKEGASGLLFLGDNMNDRLDSDYLLQERVISFLQSAGAVFLRGNHDISMEGGGLFNRAKTPEEKAAQTRLKESFPCALYVEKTNTLYTHNGVTFREDRNGCCFVDYAFPGLSCRVYDPAKTGVSYGKQISDFINANDKYYDDFLIIDLLEDSGEDINGYLEDIPSNKRPSMDSLNEVCTRLSIKQVAGHDGFSVQKTGAAIRINGVSTSPGGKKMYIPVGTITGI